MQTLWKILASAAYFYWAWQLPEYSGPYPTDRMIVVLIYVLVMMYTATPKATTVTITPGHANDVH
jgi:hypothetical protein